MAYYRPKKGERDGTPTITVPRTLTQCTYFNVPLAMKLQDSGIELLNFDIDKQEKTIRIVPARAGQKGYKVLRTGRRGYGVTPKLRKELPAGRYRLISSRGRAMVFERA